MLNSRPYPPRPSVQFNEVERDHWQWRFFLADGTCAAVSVEPFLSLAHAEHEFAEFLRVTGRDQAIEDAA